MFDFKALQAEVARETDLVAANQKAQNTLQGQVAELTAKLNAAVVQDSGVSQADIDAMVATLKSANDILATVSAITANTQAATPDTTAASEAAVQQAIAAVATATPPQG